MNPLWQRLLRLLREPRIRLSGPGLSAVSLSSGDRLQIGSRLWRVEARGASSAGVFELAAADGPPDRARLVIAGERWRLDSDGRTIELDPAAMIHYPMSSSRAETPIRGRPERSM
jgi:hypothetical protein